MTGPFEPVPGPEPTSPGGVPSPSASTVEPQLGIGPTGHLQPMTPVSPYAPGGAHSRRRWAVVGVATVVVVVLLGVLVAVAGQGSTSSAIGPRYLPATTVAYYDLRLDLPGDQAQAIGTFLARLPGFKDATTIPQALGLALGKVTAMAPGGLSYTTDISPWFGGQLGVGVMSVSGPTPTPAPPSGGPLWQFGGGRGSYVAVASVSDVTKARAFLDARKLGTPSAYGTATLWVLPSHDGATAAVALTSDALLLGSSEATVKSAIDVAAGKGASLAQDAGFRSATGALRADRLGTFYLSSGFMKDALAAENALGAARTPSASMVACLGSLSTSQVATAIAGEFHVEGANLVAETRATAGSGATPPPTHPSTLVHRVPSSSVLYEEVQGVGDRWSQAMQAMTCLQGMGAGAGPAGADLGQIETLVGGDLKTLLSWAGDAALVMTADGGNPDAGLVATVTDQAAASRRAAALGALMRMAAGSGSGGSSGGGLSVADESYAGTTLTVLTIEAPSGTLPSRVKGPFKVAYALKGDLFVLGGEGFVKAVLDTKDSASLATVQRFQSAMDGVSASGPQVYADLTAIRGVLEPLILAQTSAQDQARYQQDVVPYLAAFDRVAIGQRVDGSTAIGRIVLYTK